MFWLPFDGDGAGAGFRLEELGELQIGDGFGEVGDVDRARGILLRDVHAVVEVVVTASCCRQLGGVLRQLEDLAEILHFKEFSCLLKGFCEKFVFLNTERRRLFFILRAD